MGMTEVACSSGSACTSTTLEPSYVLKAMGLDETLVHASIRFGLGRWTTQDDVDSTVQTVVSRVKRLRRCPRVCDAGAWERLQVRSMTATCTMVA